jgi:hypothetical protein
MREMQKPQTSAHPSLAVLSVPYWPRSILLGLRRLGGWANSDGLRSSKCSLAEEAVKFTAELEAPHKNLQRRNFKCGLYSLVTYIQQGLSSKSRGYFYIYF